MKDPGVAAVLSFFIPGVGQIYNGKWLRGIFWLVINAAMIELASAIVPGFRVDTFAAAFWGAIVLSLVNMFFRWLIGPATERVP